MKTRNLLILLTSLLVLPLSAQTMKESDLPQDEQDHLKAARNAAYKADPAIKQMQADTKQARRDAMVKADPSVAPILDKSMPLSGPAQVKAADLPVDEKAKYDAARKAADKADPTLKQREAAAKQSLYEAMVKVDASVQSIVSKVAPAK
jgi:hypothetical protein